MAVLPSVCLLVGPSDEAKQARTDRKRSAEYEADDNPDDHHCYPADDHHADRRAEAEIQPLTYGQDTSS